MSFALVATFVNSSDLVVAADSNMAEMEASGSNIKQSRTTIEGDDQLIGVVLWFTVFPEIVIQRETGMIKAHPDRSVLGWFARVDTDIGEFMFWVHPLYDKL